MPRSNKISHRVKSKLQNKKANSNDLKKIKNISDEIDLDLDKYYTGDKQFIITAKMQRVIDKRYGKRNSKKQSDIDIMKDIVSRLFNDDIDYFYKLMKQHKRLVNRKLDGGLSLLHIACCNEKLDFIPILLELGANIDERDEIGKGIQHYAVISGNPLIIDVINKYGIDMNVQDNDGDTPLHYAVSNSDKDIVEKLIECNVNPLIKNKNNRLAMDYSINNSQILLRISEYIAEYSNKHVL